MSDEPRYEFTPTQNDLIGRLAAKMRGVGFVYIMFGLLGVTMAGLVALAGWLDARASAVHPTKLWPVIGFHAVAGVVNFFIGAWTFKAGKAFIRITDTRGRDIDFLMDAIGELYKTFSLLFTLMALGAILFLLAVGVAVAGALAVPA